MMQGGFDYQGMDEPDHDEYYEECHNMDEPYGYDDQEFADDYGCDDYGVTPDQIEQEAMMIFRQHDQDGSGTLNMYEFPRMLQHFFRKIGEAPPSQMDTMYMMKEYDENRDQQISYQEFRTMLYQLSGGLDDMEQW